MNPTPAKKVNPNNRRQASGCARNPSGSRTLGAAAKTMPIRMKLAAVAKASAAVALMPIGAEAARASVSIIVGGVM
jgi:hypothetical protein